MAPDPKGSTEYKVAAEAPQPDGELPSDPSGCRCDPDHGLVIVSAPRRPTVKRDSHDSRAPEGVAAPNWQT